MKDIKKEIADLKARIQELENQIAEPIKWSPVGGEYYVCNGNTIKAPSSMTAPREFGMERPTKEQAERAAVEMRGFNRLLALRDEFGAGNWTIGKTNYYIYYDYINGNYRVCTNSSTQIMGAVYFTSQESVKKACDMLNSGEVEL